MQPKIHQKIIDFLIDSGVGLGIILGGEMAPKSHLKNDEILIDFLMIFGRLWEPKWEARGAGKVSKKGAKIRAKRETPSGSAQGTKMEAK